MAGSTPTLEDVARLAGVSTATVSRCLNSPDRVIEDTRRRVLEAVQALGYSPNFGARALASRRTNTIGAIIPTMENAIFARGIQAFQEELRTRGYTLLVASSSYQPDIEAEQIRTLVARGADGLLLIGYQRETEIYDFLERQGVPALVAWAYQQNARVPSVGFDNKGAMQAVAELVIERGHRKIGVISAPMQHNDRARARVDGIKAAMQVHGISLDNLQVVQCAYGIENGAEAFSELMGRPERPSAVMCGNDVLAVGAIMRAREMGLSVPGDVAVTGFDDIDIARVAYPALTTMHVPHQEMGRMAAEMLLAMVLGNDRPASVLLDTQIRKRASLT